MKLSQLLLELGGVLHAVPCVKQQLPGSCPSLIADNAQPFNLKTWCPMSNPQVTGTYRWLWTCTGVGQINTSGCGSGLGEVWGKYTLQTVSGLGEGQGKYTLWTVALDLEWGGANTHFGLWLWTWSGAGQIHTLRCGSELGEGWGKYTVQTDTGTQSYLLDFSIPSTT